MRSLIKPLLFLLTTLAAPYLFANTLSGQAIIHNDFGYPMRFILHQHADIVLSPRIRDFVLKNHETMLVILQSQQTNEVYISAYGPSEKPDVASTSAFFGLELIKNHVIIHGYIDEGIAYSWNNRAKRPEVTFCQPKDYHRFHHCN